MSSNQNTPQEFVCPECGYGKKKFASYKLLVQHQEQDHHESGKLNGDVADLGSGRESEQQARAVPEDVDGSTDLAHSNLKRQNLRFALREQSDVREWAAGQSRQLPSPRSTSSSANITTSTQTQRSLRQVLPHTFTSSNPQSHGETPSREVGAFLYSPLPPSNIPRYTGHPENLADAPRHRATSFSDESMADVSSEEGDSEYIF